MKNIISKTQLLMVILMLVFAGCQKQENNVIKKSLFTSLKTYSLSENLNYISKNHNLPKENIKILKIRIGLERCAPGWGICSIEILGTVIWDRVMPTISMNEESVLLPIVEENSDSFVYVLLNEDVSEYDASELIFKVDSDKITYDSENNIYKILKGNYTYNDELGEFGGYRINVYKN